MKESIKLIKCKKLANKLYFSRSRVSKFQIQESKTLWVTMLNDWSSDIVILWLF